MNCLIVDDDPIICDLIEHFCSKISEIESTTITKSGFEAIQLLTDYNYDIVFLDFDLPDINGQQILEVINNQSHVIMITSNASFAADSYNYESIIDFLVKPIEFGRFFKAVSKALQLRVKAEQEFLFIKDGAKLIKIEFENAQFFKSEANYTSVNIDGKKVLTLITMKELEKQLPNYFIRVHRSYIVNLNHIKSIQKGECTVGVETIPVSNSFEKELLKRVKLIK